MVRAVLYVSMGLWIYGYMDGSSRLPLLQKLHSYACVIVISPVVVLVLVYITMYSAVTYWWLVPVTDAI